MKSILTLGLFLFALLLAACAQTPQVTLPAPTNSIPTSAPVVTASPQPTPTAFPTATLPPASTLSTATTVPAGTGLWLDFKRKGGIAGFCDSLRVAENGSYSYANECRGTTRTGQLSNEQLSTLSEWIARLRTFTFRDEPSPLPPDYLVVVFTLNGKGRAQETSSDIEQIKTLASSVINALAVTTNPAPAASPTAYAATGTLVYTREGNRLFARDLATNREWFITEAMRDYDFTGNGRRLVMVDPIESGPMGSIRTIHLDGTNAKKLTNSLNDMHPRWSPDGSRILFERNVVMDEARNFVLSAEVWLMNADGSAPQKLADGFDPEWSPEGKRIAYVTNPAVKGKSPSDPFGYKQNALGLMNAAGENKWTPVTTQTSSANFTTLQWNMTRARLIDAPNWSPEGNEIIFRVLDGNTTYLGTDATRGGITSFLWLEFDNLARGFSYSPNGKYITIGLGGNSGFSTLGVFNRTDVGNNGYTLAQKIAEFGTVPRVAGQTGSNVLGFAWSPDGNSLAYVLASGASEHPTGYALWIESANGQNARVVVPAVRAPILWVK